MAFIDQFSFLEALGKTVLVVGFKTVISFGIVFFRLFLIKLYVLYVKIIGN